MLQKDDVGAAFRKRAELTRGINRHHAIPVEIQAIEKQSRFQDQTGPYRKAIHQE